MESNIFSWKNWDQVDPGQLSFIDCILKIDVGRYKAGTEIHKITIYFDAGRMSFYDKYGAEIKRSKLSLNVED